MEFSTIFAIILDFWLGINGQPKYLYIIINGASADV